MLPEIREETQQLAHSQCDKGLALLKGNRAGEAIVEFSKAETSFESLQNFHWLNFLRKKKLICLKALNKQDEIANILGDLEKGYLETNDKQGLTEILVDMGKFYYEKDEYRNSLKNLYIAHYLLRRDRNSRFCGNVHLKMAQNKICLEEYVEALNNLSNALLRYQEDVQSLEYLYCLQLSGFCYEKLFQISEAEQQYFLARKGYLKIGDMASELLISRQLQQLYLDSYQTKKAHSISLELKQLHSGK